MIKVRASPLFHRRGDLFMPTHLVNLDALIKREDFESSPDATAIVAGDHKFKLDELQRSKIFFAVLRKPDFQRDTNNWSPEMIVEFIESFLDNELIPSIIIWHSKQTNKIFIIDGAHRVSVLIAWVNDDYGDGEISKQYFGSTGISQGQLKLASQTRELIKQKIGSYNDLLHYAFHQEDTQDLTKRRRAYAIASSQLQLQKVEGDAKIAEDSFFKINGNPAVIDPTELDIIKARRKPNAIATRALMRAGTGHKYWGGFSGRANEIEDLAKAVYDMIFGQIVEIGSQSPDVPRAGQPYSAEAFKMMLDMVNVFNNVTDAMWRQQKEKKRNVTVLADDHDGTKTIAFLEKLKEVGRLVSGNEYSGSLGLDYAVYSYGARGNFHPAAFIAAIKFALKLKAENKLERFTDVRADFEEFLVRHKSFINQLGHSKGSRTRSVESLLTMYDLVLDSMHVGEKSDEKIIEQLHAYKLLENLKAPQSEELDEQPRRRVSKSVQNALIVRDILQNRAKCAICGARLPPSSRSKDHKIPGEEFGMGSEDNIQFTHPYCNSGYKEAKRAREKKDINVLMLKVRL
jgi:hypothetical protein